MEKSVEELEKEITCVICHDHYTEPKMLPCCHCYCKDCIHKLALRKGIDKPFSCPNCRTDTTLPQGGVASLKPAFFINRLVEIYSKLLSHDKVEVRCENCSGEKAEAFCRQCTMFICGECVRLHCTLKAFAGHKTVSLKELKEGKDMAEEAAFQTCPEHEELMEIYCFDCCRLICRPCTIRDHIGHNHEFIKKAASKVKRKMNLRKEGGDDVAAADRKAMEELRDRNTVLQEQIRKYSQTNAQQSEELTQKLEEVTLERDTLKSNQGRVQAMFETRARRQQDTSCVLKGGDDGAAAAIEELRDRNTALQEQIREYSQTILEQRKSMSELRDKNTVSCMAELQDTRVVTEEELRRLREELTSALHENASLREGSQPQNYASLKYESVVATLREAQVALSDEKKMNSQLQSANLELHQKLVSATDPDKLKSIQERMVRYKNECDIARLDLEGAQAQLVTAEIDAKSAQNANMIQLQSKENEIAHLMEECETYQTRMLGYREERNKYRDHAKSLKQQLKSVEELRKPATPGAELDEGGAEVEHPGSPNHDHHYASPTLDYVPPLPTLDYAPEQYVPLQDYVSSATTIGRTASLHPMALPKALSEGAQAKPPKADSCLYRTVSVMTKGGVRVEMDIQRPSSAQLIAKQKPQVVLKRETEFETGTLAFTGRVGGKELAGVIMDVKIAQKLTASSSMDGTCKDGKRYFRCASGYGMYLPLSRVYIEMESAMV